MMSQTLLQWTTDEDLTEAIQLIGISDVLEIKFFENRANGQSKGWDFYLVFIYDRQMFSVDIWNCCVFLGVIEIKDSQCSVKFKEKQS